MRAVDPETYERWRRLEGVRPRLTKKTAEPGTRAHHVATGLPAQVLGNNPKESWIVADINGEAVFVFPDTLEAVRAHGPEGEGKWASA